MKSHHLLLALFSLTNARIPGTRIYGDVASINNTIWLSHFSAPNATSSVGVTGFNTTQRYPGSTTADWRYTVDVVADLPLTRDRGFTAASWIRLAPPESLLRDLGNGSKVLDIDESWSVCQIVWRSDKASRAEEVNGDTCEGALDKTCYDAWIRELRKRPARATKSSCPDVKAPKECEGALGFGERVGGSEGYGLGPMGATNLTVNNVNGTFSLWQGSIRGESHEAGNTTAYDLLARSVYIIGHHPFAQMSPSGESG
ncbi:hypothetical protein QBC47DRAFT_407880 [Echria macrotheca]|uniref:Uncharacterized protein n=1 Tax=Echria macrotheca TaxID=438768 RepID=A0AAJ0B0U2_9PEZI|nr:hypothetical protein QBC47DRAFT_407880 [Echria macrotheca]